MDGKRGVGPRRPGLLPLESGRYRASLSGGTMVLEAGWEWVSESSLRGGGGAARKNVVVLLKGCGEEDIAVGKAFSSSYLGS